MNVERDRVARIVAASLLLAGGLVHLGLWYDGYRDIDRVGPMFMINVIASNVLAIALLTWNHWAPVLGSLGLANGTLLAFGVSRTDWDVLGFNEKGWSPSPEALLTLIFEIGAAAALVFVLAATPLPQLFDRRR